MDKYIITSKSLGITIGFLRRARAFLWSMIGVAFLFYAGMLNKEDSAKPAKRSSKKTSRKKSVSKPVRPAAKKKKASDTL